MNIVVTGATRGIGKAIVLKFAEKGFDVSFFSRQKKNVDDLSKQIQKKFPAIKVIAQPCDANDKKQLQQFADRILKEWKNVDVLVNNAGVFIPGKVIDEKEGVLEELMQTNVYGAYHFTRMLLPAMLKKKSGDIFNMCSVASLRAYNNGGSYAISKHALLGFSRNLREEIKEYNVRVTAILAGAVLTDSWSNAKLPDSRFIKPEDIAELIFNIYSLSRQTVVEEILVRPLKGDI
jgi:NADP-dependent 3-hydroxy acid dehydrogenase YdfG